MSARSAVWAVVWAMVAAGCQGGIGSAAGPAEKAPGRSGAEATPTPKPTPAPIVLEQGTPLVMALETTVSTASAKPGDIVLARLLEPVRRGEKVLVPEGAEVRGKVTTAVRPGKVKGRARLVVDFERLTVDGRPHEIAASAIDITASNSKKRDAALIGGGAGAGAIIGGIADGGKGAAIGGLIGGAAGTGAVLTTRGKDVVLPAGSQVKVKLSQELRLQG
jgi:hypothetical protein